MGMDRLGRVRIGGIEMKTIGRKLKAIYIMAVIALVSICMSFIPLMTNTVKASETQTATSGLRITGAQVRIIDGETQENGSSQFALYFHAEITEEFYDTLSGDSIQFGMIIGPVSKTGTESFSGTVADFDAAKGALVTDGTVADGMAANFRFVGDGLMDSVTFENGIKTFEAGIVFDEADLEKSGVENALKKAAALELTAIPYYVIDNQVTMNALDSVTRTAKDVLVETSVRIANDCSDSDLDQTTVNYFVDKYVGPVSINNDAEYYYGKQNGKIYAPNANNELVALDVASIDAAHVAVAGIPATTAYSQSLENIAEKSVFGIACTDDAGNVEVIPVKVITKVLSTLNDFFADADGNGTVESTEMTRANYIFNLLPLSATGAANPTIAIKGHYVLANNIDLKNNGSLYNRSMTATGGDGSGDHTVQIFDGSQDVGFRGTLDGRGFALKNINPSGSSAGMFGAFYGATVKNIAFDGATNSAGNGSGLVIGYAYNSTFENVYIRLIGNVGGDSYSGVDNSWRALVVSNSHGPSTFTNLVVESMDGLAAGKTNHHQRYTFGDNPGAYINAALVGMPATFSTTATTVDPSKYVLTITISAEAIANFGADGDVEYALADCPKAATVYADLITNIESRRSIDIAYIKFIADVEGRAYYTDNAGLGASESASVYAESGCWAKLGNQLIWKSLVNSEAFTVKTDSGNASFKDSIDVEMYYGDTKVDAELSVSGEGADLVEVSGNTISIKADAVVVTDTALTATLTCGDYTKSIDLTLLFDIDKVVTYESGEFIIDKATGKVLKSNANNELVPYNATYYLAGETEVSIGSSDIAVANRTAFAFDKASLTALVDGEKYVLTAGENLLVARVVTKVFFTINDLFVDANSDGTLADDEKTQENFIFALTTANKVITGYYVLANNIDLAYNGNLTACSGETAVPSGASFQATLDGRGFAFTSVQLFTRAGMFGALSNATIKNIAFINMRNVRNNGASTYLASSTSASTIENVYLTIDEYWLTWNQADRNTAPVFGGISNSTFTNVLFENNAWKSSNENYQRSENSWAHFSAMATSGTYNNVNSIGAPSTIARSTHISATAAEDGVAKHKLTITLPLATINKYVATPGIYALADCGGAEVDYARLIAGINLGDGLNIQYIEFIADTTARGYYYDNAALSADDDVVDAYIATDYWKMSGTSLVWASLATKEHNYVSAEILPTCTEDGYTMYTCTCGCGDSYAVDFVASSGHTPDLNSELCIVCGEYVGTIALYDKAEFVIDRATGKVLKANAKNELVAYESAEYLAGLTEVSIGGSDITVVDTDTFTLDKESLSTLVDGDKYIIKAGENLLLARVVTKVFFNANDFFNDTDGDNVGDIAAANYIFAIDITGGKTTAKHTGYYVLANNIDTAYNGALIAHNSSSVASNTSDDVGFQGTLDGRGFALSNLSVFNCSGMFGILKNATIKDIALTNFYNTRDDANARYIASYIVNSTIENVYISIGTKTLGYDQPYRTATPIFGTISKDCTLENVLFENNIWKSDSYNKNENAWAFLSYADTSTNSNVNSIGIPNAVARSQQIASTASDDGIAKYKLTLTLPSATIAAYGVQTGTVYAITDEVAAAAVADYQKLIDGIHAYDGTSRGTKKFDLTYIEFVAETTNRGYYYDNAKVVADATVADAYVATGFWKVVEGALVWASL